MGVRGNDHDHSKMVRIRLDFRIARHATRIHNGAIAAVGVVVKRRGHIVLILVTSPTCRDLQRHGLPRNRVVIRDRQGNAAFRLGFNVGMVTFVCNSRSYIGSKPSDHDEQGNYKPEESLSHMFFFQPDIDKERHPPSKSEWHSSN